ncbi:hypothetical protein BJX70DRAFT_367937 [Aspergillus crustosus]
MSGLEVAGVVLGAIPLIIEAGKMLHSRGGILAAWWRDEQIFNQFINDIDWEYHTFTDLVGTLLSPCSISDYELKRLLQADRLSSIDFALQKELTNRLGGGCDRFIRELEAMKTVVFEIIEILPIVDGKVYLPRESEIGHELKRIKDFILNRQPILLSPMKKSNGRLKELLEVWSYQSASSYIRSSTGNAAISIDLKDDGSRRRPFTVLWQGCCNAINPMLTE